IYDQVLVVGMREVYDLCTAYQFPVNVADKVKFCGYVRKPTGAIDRSTIRENLGLAPADRLVLVTPGGAKMAIHS
ncbi:MAG: glycosyltransferase, partial [Alkalinema sp. RL_2_19]|nr:glycosyltransferase [Alkalinema sp. RL_2_19]